MPPNPAITPAAVAAGALSNPQRRVLSTLAAARGPMPRKTLARVCFRGNAVNFAPILDPLVEAGLILTSRIDVDGRTEEVFGLATAGQQAASKMPAADYRDNSSGSSHKGLPPMGESFNKTFRGIEHVITVVPEGFRVDAEADEDNYTHVGTYGSLTAAAKAIRGDEQSVNGWAFFGLVR